MSDQRTALDAVAARRRDAHRARLKATTASSALERAIVTAAESGATQRQIAAQAGVSQPYVARLLRDSRRFQPHSTLGRLLASKRVGVLKVLRAHGVQNVAVFGSVAEGTDGPDSDIDLMIDLPEDVGLFALGRMEKEVSDLLGVTVDLVPRRIMKPAIRERSERTAVPL